MDQKKHYSHSNWLHFSQECFNERVNLLEENDYIRDEGAIFGCAFRFKLSAVINQLGCSTLCLQFLVSETAFRDLAKNV